MSTSVLVVEDDPDNRELLLDMLRLYGFVATGASDGSEALDLLRTGDVQPSVIVLDLDMPRVDGLQFLDEQSKDDRIREVPVVVVSACYELDSWPRTGRWTHTLQKPIEVGALIAAVESCCL